MLELIASPEFNKWQKGLRDRQAKIRIADRLDRVRESNFGDVKAVGAGISELRIPYGPGYRIYFTQRGNTVVVLLCGGDKSTQSRDIERAKQIAADY